MPPIAPQAAGAAASCSAVNAVTVAPGRTCCRPLTITRSSAAIPLMTTRPPASAPSTCTGRYSTWS
ncbi:MAG: hypothetical protein R2864_14170 [Syntrophotaleaceae bacterium]